MVDRALRPGAPSVLRPTGRHQERLASQSPKNNVPIMFATSSAANVYPIVYLPGLRNDRVAIAIALASANSVAAKSLLRRREGASPKNCHREQSRRSAAVALSRSLLSSPAGSRPKSGLDDCYPRSFLEALEVSKHTNLGFYPLCVLHWLKSNPSRARTFPLSLVARAAYPPRCGREDALQQIGEVTSGSSTDDIALAVFVFAGKRLSKR